MPQTKTREDIVNECAGAVARCFDHYSDYPLGARETKKLAKLLAKELPLEISVVEWERRAAEYEAAHADELAEKRALTARANAPEALGGRC